MTRKPRSIKNTLDDDRQAVVEKILTHDRALERKEILNGPRRRHLRSALQSLLADQIVCESQRDGSRRGRNITIYDLTAEGRASRLAADARLFLEPRHPLD